MYMPVSDIGQEIVAVIREEGEKTRATTGEEGEKTRATTKEVGAAIAEDFREEGRQTRASIGDPCSLPGGSIDRPCSQTEERDARMGKLDQTPADIKATSKAGRANSKAGGNFLRRILAVENRILEIMS